MTLGERCDEIVRLIDETLYDIAAHDDEDEVRCPHDDQMSVALTTSRRLVLP